MKLQLFFSTFVLIFLAELGDKTQLAAMARAASSGSAKWTIFFAASAALVFSTLIAVLVGGALTRVIPEKYIRIGAGVLFVIFGVLLVRDALKTPGEITPTESAQSGIVSIMLRGAAELERTAFEDYSHMSEDATLPALRALLLELAHEEERHFEQLLLVDRTGAKEGAELEPTMASSLPPYERLQTATAPKDLDILEIAIRHEESTAGFYRELARLTPIASFRRALTTLANAETEHALRLRKLLPDVD